MMSGDVEALELEKQKAIKALLIKQLTLIKLIKGIRR